MRELYGMRELYCLPQILIYVGGRRILLISNLFYDQRKIKRERKGIKECAIIGNHQPSHGRRECKIWNASYAPVLKFVTNTNERRVKTDCHKIGLLFFLFCRWCHPSKTRDWVDLNETKSGGRNRGSTSAYNTCTKY